MKEIAEILYKIYLKREVKHEIEKPVNFDEIEQKFVKSLSKEQHAAYLDLETDFYDIVFKHCVALLRFFLEMWVADV